MSRLQFVKMEGAGNDYIYVVAARQPFPIDRASRLVPRLADRHFGIGGDGLILLSPSPVADVRMEMWNADGSRGGMCGNGLRCLAKLAHDEGLVAAPTLTVETDTGIKTVELCFAGDRVVGARASMGPVTVAADAEEIEAAGRRLRFHVGDAGNPHAVVFVDDPEQAPVAEIGAALQSSPRFPGGVNVEFVAVAGPSQLVQRTYERGSGETLACGSGATVAAVAAWQTGRVRGSAVEVRLRGGVLTVEKSPSSLVLVGPARTVFRGEVELPDD